MEKIDELYKQGILYYTAGEYELAINTWKEILLIDKLYDPAINAISSTEKYLNMLNGVQELSIQSDSSN